MTAVKDMTAQTVDRTWRAWANCRGRNTEIFFASQPTSEMAALCRHCPVRAACLDEAMRNNEAGFWGGVSQHAREAIKRGRMRRTCPACGSDRLWNQTAGFQVCRTCKLSWRVRTQNSAAGDCVQPGALSA